VLYRFGAWLSGVGWTFSPFRCHILWKHLNDQVKVRAGAKVWGGAMSSAATVLEVERGANDADVKTAFRKLAMKWHPDRNPATLERAALQGVNESMRSPGWREKRTPTIASAMPPGAGA
jgi:hypothetical protein